MYLEPWQIFLWGCIIGTLISFIVIFVVIRNILYKIGLRGVAIQKLNPDSLKNNTSSEETTDTTDADAMAKLSFILLNRGYITDDDVEFIMDHISFDDWKTSVEQEIEKSKKHQDDDT